MLRGMMKYSFPIIEKLGGREAVFKKLRTEGDIRATVDSLRMWENPKRAVIPGQPARLLIKIAQKESIPFTADDFFLQQIERKEG